MSLWSRVANVFRAGAVERELDEELQFHIDERMREAMADGLSREAAAARVRRRFGSSLWVREQSRDVRLLSWLDSLVRDVRLGVRMLRKHAAVTLTILVSLSLAVGACLAAFLLVDALILRPLPVRHPEQLIYLAYPTDPPDRPESDTFNDPTLVRLRDAGRGHVDLFAMSTQVMRPAVFEGGQGDKEQVRTQFVSGDAFERLGVASDVGRTLARSDDDRPGASPVAVLSHAFWTRRFGGDPAIVGRSFTLEARVFQIVGVAERRFSGVEPGRPTDVWLPYAMYNPRAFGNASFNWFRIFGRLTDNVRAEQAQAVLQAAFTNLRRERVSSRGPENRSAARFVETPLHLRPAANGPSPLRRQFERPLWILASIAALVLLVAGSNVANLFLARWTARERELALRLAIGAGRSRLVQQVIVESALVAGAASVLGLLLARAAATGVVGMIASSNDLIELAFPIGWRVVAVAGALAAATTTLFGLVPALRVSGVAPMAALQTSSDRTRGRARMMRPFVAAQVAFGMIVLFVGSLLLLSFSRLSNVNPGFATSNVLLISVETTERADSSRQRRELLQLLDRLRTVPGVDAVSSAEFNALGRAWTYFLQPPERQEPIETTMAPVTHGYFETMRIPIMSGRSFVAGDITSDHPHAIVVTESLAARYFGREPAVGRSLNARFGIDSEADGVHEIVGVAADTKYDLRKAAEPTIYIPLPLRTNGMIHVRVTGDPAAVSARVREEVRASLFRVTSVGSQAAALDRTLVRERLLALLSGFFAAVGLVLVVVGLYGVLNYSVVRRTRDIGIRAALGAGPGRVIWSVFSDTARTALAGAAVGLAGGLVLSRFVRALLFEVTALDAWSLLLPIAVLALASAAAVVAPALRAARVDPVIALRYDG